jgi:hemolysin activation/secretion protein
LRTLFIIVSLTAAKSILFSSSVLASDTTSLREILKLERIRPERERETPTLPGAPPAEHVVPQEPEGPQFTLRAVILEGAEAIEPDDLRSVYEDMLDRPSTVADIETVLDSITRVYRERGYFLSRAIAPPQDLADGVLRVRVIEGYVSEVEFKGPEQAAINFRNYAKPVLDDRPLRLPVLERAILLISDVSGVVVRPSLEPEDEERGRYRLVLAIDQSPVDGLVLFDNSGSPSAGPLQAVGVAGVNSLLDLRERFQLTFSTVPNEVAEFWSARAEYLQPVGSDGLALSLSAAASRAHNDRDRWGTRGDASGRFLGMRVQYPLIRSLRENLWINGTVDAYRLTESEEGAMTSRDDLRVLRTGVNYATQDDAGARTLVSCEISQGVPVLGASHENPDNDPSLEGNTRFTKAMLTAAREQPLGGDVSLWVEVAGQKAFQRLAYAEEFGVGGSPYGRGYDFYEVSGDDGIAGNIEVRYTPDLKLDWLPQLQPFAFFGGGRTWDEDIGEHRNGRSLASTGVGVRARLPYGIRAEIAIAERLPSLGETRTDSGTRFLFSLQKQF